jgi:hypothetical protein
VRRTARSRLKRFLQVTLMRTSGRSLILIAIVGAACSAGGCALKTIDQVLADPARYADRPVTVRGEVVQSYSVLGRGAYEVRDRTGRLWVVSDRGVPRKGTRVQVKGTVRDALGVDLPVARGFGTLMHEASRKAQR